MAFLLLLVSALVNGVIGSELRIASVDEFFQFKDNVNRGTSYEGTTVFLESDLSFDWKSFEPIGTSNQFLGTFNGQGHVISNLNMNSSLEYVGLFGYSEGLTIKNVILDSSCSITSSFSGSNHVYIGGVIGYCDARDGPCTIENSVNMGSVTFRGNISDYYLYLGGIAGRLDSSNHDATVKNCANYGDVTHSGTSRDSYIGGIVGYSRGYESTKRVYIYNCLNHGTIAHSGTTSSSLHIGRIAGWTYYSLIENCVSGGKISLLTTASSDNSIGSIVGSVSLDTTINYTYFTSGLSGYEKYGSMYLPPSEYNTFSYDSTTFELNETVSIGSYSGTALIDALNAAADYYTLRDYSHWLLNKENNAVSFTINKNSPFTLNSQVILLPSLASEENMSFDGWYTDDGLTTLLTEFEVTSETELYGSFEENTNKYTISFDTRREGASVLPITAPFGSVVELPSDLTREHCVVTWWENMYGDNVGLSLPMPSHNITLYAVWKCTRIKTLEDFIDFSKVVNNGTNYEGSTVFLDSDLSLAGKTFEPIGTDSNYFNGVFDGQGHAISNLKMTSSLQYVGLFGYSGGLTIRNVILDSSCSFTSSLGGSDDAYIGGITGYCYAYNEPCTIENSVNMGSVTFSGTVSGGYYYLLLGGIAGYLYSSIYDIVVKNCANYGDVTHSGKSRYSLIGGIVGYSDSSSSKRVYIYNCLNHGTITHSGTTTNELDLGGIVGESYCTTIENCVSGGKISSTKSSYIGSIVGYVYSDTSINYAYFTNDLSGYDKYGRLDKFLSESNVLSYDSTTFDLNGTVSIGGYTGTSLIGALNAAADYYTLRDYSHWLINKGKNAVSFTINGRISPIEMNSQVILLPSLASEGNMSFDGWYTDDGLTTPLTEYGVTSETELYGRFEENTNNYTISFKTRREGVSVPPITAPFGSVVTLPSESIRKNCTVGFWETDYGDYIGFSLSMPSHNITLYAVWKCTRIETPEDFISLSEVVNNGLDSFNGTTVFLDSDLSLAGKSFEPIGTDFNHFNGVFDGQGHVISNLVMTSSSSQFVGLFGYSDGLTIKNVILDSSCSITSSFSGSYDAYIGGITGYCYTVNGPCTIENSVNMGSVTFRGMISDSNSIIGGITGYFTYLKYDSTVKNCANYGDITHSGKSRNSYIGGLIGETYGSSIYNSLNHGTITHGGTTSSSLYLGGIAGYTKYITIDNCVSGGKISLPTTASSDNSIGNIVGSFSTIASINYTYFTSDLSGYNKYGGTWGTLNESNTLSYDSTSFQLNETVSIGGYTGTSLIDALNTYADYYTLRDYSHWLLNKGNNAVTFTINGKSSFALDTQVILLPSLASEGNMSFDGWYTDDGLTTLLTKFEVTSETELYGRTCNSSKFTVTLDVNGGDELAVEEMAIGCDRIYGDLPTPTRTEATFLGWFNETDGGDKIESGDEVTILNDHTLYAHWSINKYTLTFIFGNGTEPEVRVLEFNETITYPAEPVRAGYSFAGWDRKITNMPADNTTITAQWRANNYTVTFNPNGGSVSQSTTVVTFGGAYGELPNVTRTGHTFLGWFTEKNEAITGESIVKTPDNHTLYADWKEVTQSQVEIVFGTKDMSKEEIEETIKKYTDAEFTISVIESSSGDEDGMRVIVEFVDKEKANNFMEIVRASSEAKRIIRKVGFVQECIPSFSPAHLPMSLLYLI